MKKYNTSDRLHQIMEERNLRQIDILNRCDPYCKKYNVKINKSDLSQYVSGKVEPSQEKLVILGMALNVTEAWLMGLDVSPEREDFSDESAHLVAKLVRDPELSKALQKYFELSEAKKKHVIELINLFSE